MARRPVRARYALTDESVPLAGTPVARDERKGMVLLRVPGVLRQTQLVSGLYAADTWSGPRVRYERLRCRGGLLLVALDTDRQLFRRPQLVTARAGGRRFATRLVPALGTRTTFPVPLRRGADGRCTVDFTVAPTAVPAQRLAGSTDTRVLGAHFLAFRYVPPERARGIRVTRVAQTREGMLVTLPPGVAADPLGGVGR